MKMKFLLSLPSLVWIFGASLASDGIPAKGYAIFSKDGSFQPYEFPRRAVGDDDILIEILYCGVCHSDIHMVRGDWFSVEYPMVPGHEMVGRLTQIGKNVTKFKVGDYAGVGPMVDSCGACAQCELGHEQYCEQGATFTYASRDRKHGGERTQGGYSDKIVVTEKFAIKIPANAELDKVAPLFCAGISTYSPLKFTKVGKGDEVAIAGFGGLGHMALQYAVSFGAKVTVFDITEDKREDAIKLGASRYVNVKNADELKGLNNRFGVIISTIPANYDPMMYLRMLQVDGEMVVLGHPSAKEAPSVNILALGFTPRRKIYGSQIGGIRETQEVVDYSVANHIYPRVEIIPIQKLDEAYERVSTGEVKFRYVIDMKSLN